MTFEEFKILMKEWNDAVMFQSSPTSMMKHPNYQKLISYSDKELIIRYACLILDRKNVFLCLLLLSELVGRNRPPLDKYYTGRIPVILECWRYWALKENIVFHPRDENENIKYDENGISWMEDKDGNRGTWS